MSKRPTLAEIANKQKQVATAYRSVFQTAEGKIVLADLRARYYDSELFVQGDAEATCYNNGLRDAVRGILELTTTEEE